MIVETLRAVYDLAFPPICSACGRRLASDDDTVCSACRESFEPLGHMVCFRCGAPVFRPARRRCPNCPAGKVHFNRTYAAFRYTRVFPEIFRAYKYGSHYELGQPLARAMFAALSLRCETDGWPELLIPVPLHFVRYARRGFNQAEVLAAEFGRLARVEVRPDLLVRSRRTRSQALQTPEDRLRNVRGAFEVTAPDVVRERRVGLLDDILTTGSTVNEAARVLKEAGAKEVLVFALARAPAGGKSKQIDAA